MEQKELSNLRLRQTAATNGLILIAIFILYIVTNIFTVRFGQFFFVLGGLILIQAVFGFIKGDSTKSLIPIFEKVAIYEKQKMGSEWYKQRKVSYIWNIILSFLMFLQSYWQRDSTENIFQIDLFLMSIILFFLLIMINIGLIIHFRKVDNSVSVQEMKGYTWKSNLIAVAIGIVFTIIMIVITLSYIMTGIF